MKDLRARFDVLADGADNVATWFKELVEDARHFKSELGSLSKAASDSRDALNGAPSSEGRSTSRGGSEGLDAGLSGLPAMAGAVGGQIRATLTGAIAPLTSLGSQLTRQFDAVGGTLTTLARRIDASMKFSATMAAVEGLKSKLENGVTSAAGVATESLTRTQRAVLALGPGAIQALGAFKGFASLSSWFTSLGDVAGKSLSRLTGIHFQPVTASAVKLRIAVKGVGTAARQAGAGMASFGRSAMAALGVFGGAYAVVQFLKDGVKGASDLNETTNKLEVILKGSAPAAKAFADTLVNDFGLIKKEVYDAEAAFGGLGAGLGKMSGEKLSNFSNQFTKLAGDLSSIANMDLSTATNALQTALAGNQSDELKKLGVTLLDDAVKARAVAEGFAKSTKEVSESAKVQARAVMIAEQLAFANDDLKNTAAGPANSYRRMKGIINNLATTIGQSLMPVLMKIGSAFTAGLQMATSLWERNKETVTAFQESAFLAFETVKIAVGDAIAAVSNLPQAFDSVFGAGTSDMIGAFSQSIVDNIGAAVTGVGSFLRNMPDYFAVFALQSTKWIHIISANLANFGEWFGNEWAHLLTDGINLITRAFLDFSSLLGRLGVAVAKFLLDPTKGFQFDWTPMLKGFQATTAKLPELVQPELAEVNKEIDAAWDRIGKKDAEIRAKVKSDVAAATAPAAPAKVLPQEDKAAAEEKKPAKAKEMESAGAFELGSKEAYSAIAKARSRMDDRMYQEAKAQTGLLRDIAGKGKARPAMAGNSVPVTHMT